MKKIFFSALALLFTITAAFSQNADSLSFKRADWQKKKIAPRVKLLTCHFKNKQLFSANENISYLELKNNGRRNLLTLAADEKTLIKTSEFGAKAGAIAALNCNFFDVKNGGAVDYTRLEGKVINETRLEKNGKRSFHQRAALVFDNGIINIKKWDGTAGWETSLPERTVALAGPLLIFNAVEEVLDTVAFNRLRHPRTCIGIKPNGKVLLFTVDGRNENSAGMSLFELTKVMRWLGCTTAINLDGGGLLYALDQWISGWRGRKLSRRQ